MRTIQLITLALLATVARADTVQAGIFTVTGLPQGVDIASVVQGNSFGGILDYPSAVNVFLTVAVPAGWAIGGAFNAYESADIPVGVFTGVEGGLAGYDGDGNLVGVSRDLGNWGWYLGPCTDCGFGSMYDFVPIFTDIPIRRLTLQEDVLGGGAEIDLKSIRLIGEFTAIEVPEPSAFLLLATVVIGLGCRRRWRPS